MMNLCQMELRIQKPEEHPPSYSLAAQKIRKNNEKT